MQTKSKWIICHKPNPRALARLFCFPFAGGAASHYRTWPDSLPAEVEVLAIQPPGRERRIAEPPFSNLKELIQSLTPAILPYLDKPFAFFGHSLGAITAFDLARELRRKQTAEPFCLFASSRYAPHLEKPALSMTDLPDPEFIDKLRVYGGTPDEILNNPEIRALFLPVLRADFRMNEKYAFVPEEPLGCPISASGGVDDHLIPQSTIEEWKGHTRNSFILRMYPGNHFYLNTARDRLISAVAQDLLRFMSRNGKNSGSLCRG